MESSQTKHHPGTVYIQYNLRMLVLDAQERNTDSTAINAANGGAAGPKMTVNDLVE